MFNYVTPGPVPMTENAGNAKKKKTVDEKPLLW